MRGFVLLRRLSVVAPLMFVISCTVPTPEPVTVAPTATAAPQPQPAGWTRRTIGGGGGQAGIAIDPTNPQTIYVTTDNGGVIKSTDGGDHWFSINHNLGNPQTGDSELDPLNPQVLYVVAEVYSLTPDWSDDPANGELYRTRDGGKTWEIVYAEGMGTGRAFSVTHWPSTRSLLIPFDPADPARYDTDGNGLSDVIYVGGWDRNPPQSDKRAGIWKSTNEGQTFTQLALNDKNIWALQADPRNPEWLYAATFDDGVFASRDGGGTWESWRDRIPLPTTSDVVVDAARNTIYVATNTFFTDYGAAEYQSLRGIYKSTDGGRTFSPISTGLDPTSLGYERLLLDATDPTGQTLYTGSFYGDQPGLFRTVAGGERWSAMTLETATTPAWFEGFQNLWDIAQASDGTVIATSWRGIYRLRPGAEQWELIVNGLGNIAVRAIAFEPNNASVIYLGILDSTPWKSLDYGLTWHSLAQGFTTPDGDQTAGASDFAISPSAPQIIYATGVGPSGQYLSAVNKSTDGGEHWRPIVNGLPPTSASDPQWQANAIAVHAMDSDIAYVALELKSGEGRLYKTTNGGERWDEILASSEQLYALAVSAMALETVAVTSMRGTIYVSEDAGAQWRSSTIGKGLIYAVDVAPANPDYILIGVNIDGAYLSTDRGRTWKHVFDAGDLQPLMTGLALSPLARESYQPTIGSVKFDPDDPKVLYVGHAPHIWMGTGILRSMDGGVTWEALADRDFQMRSVSSFDLDPFSKNLVAGTLDVYYYQTHSAP
ncbi:MAG: WD40/YVTN/BNR-like repeat-containing protein [Anaerolineales bacterium]